MLRRRGQRRRSNRRLIGDRPADDGSGNEGGRREPPSIVLAITATVFPIPAMTIVVAPAMAVFEARTHNPALVARVLDATMLNPVPIVIATELHLLQADICNIRFCER